MPSSSKASSKEATPRGIARSVSAAAAVFTPLLSIEVRDVNGRAVLLVSRGGHPGRSWCWGRGKNRLDLRDGARGPSRASWLDLCKAKPSASAWGQMAADGAGRSPGLEPGPSAWRRRDPWPASLFMTALLLRGQEARFRSVRKDFVTGGPCQCGVRPCSRPRGQISVAPPWTFPEAQMQLPVADPCFCICEMPPSCWVGGVHPRTGTRGQRALGAEHGAALCPRGARRAQLGSGVHVSAWSGLGG